MQWFTVFARYVIKALLPKNVTHRAGWWLIDWVYSVRASTEHNNTQPYANNKRKLTQDIEKWTSLWSVYPKYSLTVAGRSQHLSRLVQPKLQTISNIWSWNYKREKEKRMLQMASIESQDLETHKKKTCPHAQHPQRAGKEHKRAQSSTTISTNCSIRKELSRLNGKKWQKNGLIVVMQRSIGTATSRFYYSKQMFSKSPHWFMPNHSKGSED